MSVYDFTHKIECSFIAIAISGITDADLTEVVTQLQSLLVNWDALRQVTAVVQQLIQRPIDQRFALKHAEIFTRHALTAFARSNMSDDHLSPTFFVLSTRPPPKPSALALWFSIEPIARRGQRPLRPKSSRRAPSINAVNIAGEQFMLNISQGGIGSICQYDI